MDVIQVNELTKYYGKSRGIENLSFSVHEGEIFGFIGPNGAGKSTTFYMIVGLIKPDGGSIFLDGEEISGYPMYKRARKGLNYLLKNRLFSEN